MPRNLAIVAVVLTAIAVGGAIASLRHASFDRPSAAQPAADDTLDDLIRTFIEAKLMPDSRREVSARCTHLLDVPVVADLKLVAETSEQGVTWTQVELLGTQPTDAGAPNPELFGCLTEALRGHDLRGALRVEATDGGEARTVTMPAGRAYELVISMEFARLEPQEYRP